MSSKRMGTSRIITYADLKNVVTPEAFGPHHKPVPHHKVIQAMYKAFDKNGYTILKEQLAVGNTKLLGDTRLVDTTLTAVFDLAVPDINNEGREEGTSLALISNNTKQKAIQIMGGAKVFVCDNLMITGEAIVLKKKHTLNLDLDFEIGQGFEIFTDRRGKVERTIELMKNTKVKDSEAERFLYQLYAKRVIPPKHLHGIHDWYFGDIGEEVNRYRGTVWGLHNACTREFKDLHLAQKVKRTKAIDTPFQVLCS